MTAPPLAPTLETPPAPPLARALPPRWGPLDLGAEPLGFRAGEVEFWLRRAGPELETRAVRADGPAEPPWSRWTLKDPGLALALAPALPDRPAVAEPDRPFHLAGGASVRLVVSVPVWLRLTTAAQPPQTLLELPSAVLTNTFFGLPTDGVLCYGLATTARRSPRPPEDGPHLIACPVEIQNLTPTPRVLDRICLELGLLQVYDAGARLYTDTLRLRIVEGDAPPEQEPTGRPPQEAPQAVLRTAPRVVRNAGVVGWTSTALKVIPGIGGWVG